MVRPVDVAPGLQDRTRGIGGSRGGQADRAAVKQIVQVLHQSAVLDPRRSAVPLRGRSREPVAPQHRLPEHASTFVDILAAHPALEREHERAIGRVGVDLQDGLPHLVKTLWADVIRYRRHRCTEPAELPLRRIQKAQAVFATRAGLPAANDAQRGEDESHTVSLAPSLPPPWTAWLFRSSTVVTPVDGTTGQVRGKDTDGNYVAASSSNDVGVVGRRVAKLGKVVRRVE